MPETGRSPRICLFGYFDTESARTWTLTEGLHLAGYTTTPCLSRKRGLCNKLRDLFRQWSHTQCDAMLVMFPGQYVMPFAWMLARLRGVPLIVDAFISQHDTLVRDRRLVSSWSPMAALLWMADWITCHLADLVLIDTESHRQFFLTAFNVRPSKLLAVPVGARYDLFSPAPAARHEHFTVLFHGTFIPLQGIECILRAAAILQTKDPKIALRLFGRGQTRSAMETLATELHLQNVAFFEPVPLPALAEEIRRADVGLGIFGLSDKAARVIPHKAYDILACGRPLITGDSPAARALLQDGDTALLTPMGDANALAAAILRLKKDQALASRLAVQGHALVSHTLAPSQIVAPLVAWLAQHRVDSRS